MRAKIVIGPTGTSVSFVAGPRPYQSGVATPPPTHLRHLHAGTDIITRRQTKDATSKYIQWHLGLTDEKPAKVLELSPSATS
jgi:hypothetical protein